MAFTDKRKNLLEQRDVKCLEDMLNTSLEEHLKYIDDPQSNINDPDFRDVIKQVFSEALEQLSTKIQKENEDKSHRISVSDFISDFYDEIWKKLFEKIDKSHSEYDKFILDLARGFNVVKCAQLGNDELMKICRNDLQRKALYLSQEIVKQEFDFYFKDEACLQDQKDSYENSIASFQFADKPIAGIENLLEFNPASDSDAVLFEGRKGNSETLADTSEQSGKETLAFQKGTEIAKSYASKWSNYISGNRQVTFGDLYETLTELHKAVQANSSTGGKLCGYPVHIKMEILSPGSFVIPNVLYKILDTVADDMNQIHETKDPALRKTRAVQLAAFAYQMLVSAHLLQGGNGRTSRLFADMILQTFGLPPHTPLPEEKTIGVTIGKTFDFEKGAELFLKGVKNSSDVLVSQIEVNEGTSKSWENLTQHVSSIWNNPNHAPVFLSTLKQCHALAKSLYGATAGKNINIDQMKRQYGLALQKLQKQALAFYNYKTVDDKDPLKKKKLEAVASVLNTIKAMTLSKKKNSAAKKELAKITLKHADLFVDQNATKLLSGISAQIPQVEVNAETLQFWKDANVSAKDIQKDNPQRMPKFCATVNNCYTLVLSICNAANHPGNQNMDKLKEKYRNEMQTLYQQVSDYLDYKKKDQKNHPGNTTDTKKVNLAQQIQSKILTLVPSTEHTIVTRFK